MNNYLKGLSFLALLAFSVGSYGETLFCGEKEITLEGNKIVRMKHEDGTVHTGNISRNWTYDGKSITHFIMKEPLPCSKQGKSKSRKEIIADSSASFTKNPSAYFMSAEEAKQMERYTAKLMEEDNECYIMTDAAKSSTRKGMFYIDCDNKDSQIRRFWVSAEELKNTTLTSGPQPVSTKAATDFCMSALKDRATNRSTFKASAFGISSWTVPENGRNVVEINFKASNAFGVEGKYLGRCILENGKPLEVTITEK